MNTLETPLLTSPMPADGPDWGTRPWARPIVHLAYGNTDNLVATAEVTYHGVRLRGMRLYRRPSDQSLMVLFPQKRYGETLDNVYYFMNPEEREQFLSATSCGPTRTGWDGDARPPRNPSPLASSPRPLRAPAGGFPR